MRHWGVVPFNDRWAAEYGEWRDGKFDAKSCEAIAFLAADNPLWYAPPSPQRDLVQSIPRVRGSNKPWSQESIH